jgi:hypothetical protein
MKVMGASLRFVLEEAAVFGDDRALWTVFGGERVESEDDDRL